MKFRQKPTFAGPNPLVRLWAKLEDMISNQRETSCGGWHKSHQR
jgi:hypothetical protein